MSERRAARLFAALELPGYARAALASWAARVSGQEPAVRLVPVESLHVTLVFLGSQAAEQVEAIGEAVLATSGPLEPLRVAQAAWLPPRRPGVLVADLAAQEDLMALQARVVDGLRPWHEPETRGFRPHVTVARVRRGAQIARGQPLAEPPKLAFAPSALVLYRSHTGSGGSRYEALSSVPLA